MGTYELGVSGGATFFLTSLLDHPDCTPHHVALIPYMGLGGSVIPVPVAERAAALGISLYPRVRQHRAPVDHHHARRRTAGEAAAHRRRGDARRRDPPRRRGRDHQPRPRPLHGVHRPGAHRGAVRRRRLVPHRRRRGRRRRRLLHDHRPHLRRHHPRRREHLARRRSRTRCSASTRSPRSRWSPRPTNASASTRPR